MGSPPTVLQPAVQQCWQPLSILMRFLHCQCPRSLFADYCSILTPRVADTYRMFSHHEQTAKMRRCHRTKWLLVANADLLKPDDDVDLAQEDHENPGLPSEPLRWSGNVPLHRLFSRSPFHTPAASKLLSLMCRRRLLQAGCRPRLSTIYCMRSDKEISYCTSS